MSAPAAPASPAAPPAPKKGKKLVMIVVCLVFAAAGAAVPMVVNVPALFAKSKEEKGKEAKEAKTAIVPFGEVVVNLSEDRLQRYLRIKVAVLVEAERIGAHRAFVGALGHAGFEREDPVVEWTGDRCAVDDALAQGAALVRALVVEGENPVVRRAEDGDLAQGRLDAAGAAAGNVFQAPDIDPIVHRNHSAACNIWKSAMAANSWASRPLTRSSQGSTWANFWE